MSQTYAGTLNSLREKDRIVNIYDGLLLIELLEKEVCNKNLWMKTWTEKGFMVPRTESRRLSIRI